MIYIKCYNQISVQPNTYGGQLLCLLEEDHVHPRKEMYNIGPRHSEAILVHQGIY